MTTTTHYTAYGEVRGYCGHVHRSPMAADRCAAQDQRDVVAGHGPDAYSDRGVYAVERTVTGRAYRRPLTNAELGDLEAWPDRTLGAISALA